MNVILMCCMACSFSLGPQSNIKIVSRQFQSQKTCCHPSMKKELHNLYQVQQQLEKLTVHLYMRNLIIGNSNKFNCKHSHFEEKKMVGWWFHCNCYFHFASQPAKWVYFHTIIIIVYQLDCNVHAAFEHQQFEKQGGVYS